MEEIGRKCEEIDEKFLEQIAKISHNDMLWNMETLTLYNEYSDGARCGAKESPSLIRHMTPPNPRKGYIPLEGRDFGGVKHINYSIMAEVFKSAPELGKIAHGNFYIATIELNGKETPVTIKNYQLSFPPKERFALYPAMLYNDIITTRPQKTRPNVARLIGYSIDKVLAVFYDLSPICTLDVAMFGSSEFSDQFSWKYRLKVAVDVGRAITSFHEDHISVGCVSASQMFLDKDFKVYLCNFRLQPNVQKMVSDVSNEAKELLPLPYEGYRPEYAFGIHGFYNTSENANDSSTLNKDIYAYGLLVLELISKLPVGSSYHLCRPTSQPPSNMVHESFDEIKDSDAKKLTTLAISCVTVDPVNTAIQDVVSFLMLLEKSDYGHMDKKIKM